MLEQYTDYDYTNYPHLQQPKLHQEPKRDRTLEVCTRYFVFFAAGVILTFVVRLFPQLQPLYWLLVVFGLAGLGFAIHRTGRLELLAIALVVAAALLLGHWDLLAYNATGAGAEVVTK